MPEGADSVVLSPEHKVLEPKFVIVATGAALTVTVSVAVVVHPSAVVPVTVYVPELVTILLIDEEPDPHA